VAAGEIELLDVAKVTVTRYRWRGNTIPDPWLLTNHA
jgi:RNA-directed DNA polymerase